MSTAFIELKNIVKTYSAKDMEDVPVLKWLDLTINRWDFVAIMGPSWCGKSTLMNIVWLLDEPTSWEYFINGDTTASIDENAQAIIRRQNIWFVFQWYNLLKRMSAWEQVALPLSYLWLNKSEAKLKAINALKLVGLWDKTQNLPNQLSWWQQQRVCIARAIVANAWLLLADEPTWALDSKTWVEIMELFQKLHKENWMTIMLITHDAHIAEYADKTIKMKDGIFYD